MGVHFTALYWTAQRMSSLPFKTIHTINTVGKHFLWHISDDGNLVATQFVQERVLRLPTDHTIFLRCRSFQSRSQYGGAGYAIAFSVDSQQTWNLGMLAYSHPELLSQRKVLVYE